MRIAQLLSVCFLLGLLPAAFGAPGNQDRVMVGEDILVGAHEELHDVVCIGCSIRLEGKVNGDAVVIGGSLIVEGEALGEAVAIGGSVEVPGVVHSNVTAVAGSVGIAGTSGGDVTAVMGGVDLAPGAEVAGKVTAVMGSVRGADQAQVGGEIVSGVDVAPFAKWGLVLALLFFLLAGLVVQPLLVLLCFVVLGETRIKVLAETARQRAGMSFLIGMGIIFGSIILSVVGAIIPFWLPGVGFPVSFLVFVLLVVGYSGISYWVGRGLLSSSGAMAAAVFGAVLVTILQLIPIIGWMAMAVFALLALGSALLSGFGTSVDWLVKRSEVESFAPPVAR